MHGAITRSDSSARIKRVGPGFYAVLAIASLLTFVLHEAGHWAMGIWLGHTMVFHLNGVGPAPGVVMSARDAFMVTAAGPLVTVLQALVACALIQQRVLLLAYAFVFTAWFMRFAATLVSIVHPNDEARMSLQLGLGTWLLPVTTMLGLLALTWWAAGRLRLGWRVNIACYLLCSVLFAAIIFADAALWSAR